MKVFSTLSRQKEDFLPQGDVVKMYVCGVTPYDEAHLGHAMSYIIFDVIRRYLRYKKYEVKYVQNITDIDDKIIARANQRGVSTDKLVQQYTDSFDEDMKALNIMKTETDEYPKATDHIEEIQRVIQGLVDKGYAYPAQGSVYFRVRNVSDYGKLSHRSLESMMSAEGALGSGEKESPMDFVLWKASKPGEPAWESPWGKGRPGWHIECSAMSLKYLGDTIDIHGGGQDLVFPHHENEIAQSESFTGVKPFVRYWLHNGMVQLGEEKMSKSLGNLITIKEAVDKYGADAVRVFALSSHYRSPLTYSEVIIEAAEGGLRRLIQAAHPGKPVYKGEPEEVPNAKVYYERFKASMDDDFNTPQAIAILFNLANVINRAANLDYLDKVTEHSKLFKELADVLGLILPKPEEVPLEAEPFIELQKSTIAKIRRANLDKVIDKVEAILSIESLGTQDATPYINLLRGVREALRKDNQFQLADEIRDKLAELGITLEDTSQGTIWKRKR